MKSAQQAAVQNHRLSRSGEVRLARWDEGRLQRLRVDRPGRAHEGEPASTACRSPAAAQRSSRRPSRGASAARSCSPVPATTLSDVALSNLLKEQGVHAVPHGFRSRIRDWAAEETNHPQEVVEAALAHRVKDQVEAAYARPPLFQRRPG